MLKVYFNTVVPYSERKKVIKAFKDLGFVFDRLFVPGGDVSHFVFRGKLPNVSNKNQLANFYFDECAKNQFLCADVNWIELYIDFEKRGK